MNTKFLTGVGIALAIAGCASTPRYNETLENARRIVQTAEADPNAAKYAAVDLQTAKSDLAVADAAFTRHDEPSIAQPAYMAAQNARLAQLRERQKRMMHEGPPGRQSATASYLRHVPTKSTVPIAPKMPRIAPRVMRIVLRMRQKSPAIKRRKTPRGCRRRLMLSRRSRPIGAWY